MTFFAVTVHVYPVGPTKNNTRPICNVQTQTKHSHSRKGFCSAKSHNVKCGPALDDLFVVDQRYRSNEKLPVLFHLQPRVQIMRKLNKYGHRACTFTATCLRPPNNIQQVYCENNGHGRRTAELPQLGLLKYDMLEELTIKSDSIFQFRSFQLQLPIYN